jgi:hypothetical protein
MNVQKFVSAIPIVHLRRIIIIDHRLPLVINIDHHFCQEEKIIASYNQQQHEATNLFSPQENFSHDFILERARFNGKWTPLRRIPDEFICTMARHLSSLQPVVRPHDICYSLTFEKLKLTTEKGLRSFFLLLTTSCKYILKNAKILCFSFVQKREYKVRTCGNGSMIAA